MNNRDWGRKRGGAPDRGQRPSPAKVFAPYDFVPLSRFVWEPSWGPAVSHDLPFEDGWSGELHIEVVAASPLLVGGGEESRKPASKEKQQPTDVAFKSAKREGVERWMIPGASLRGMLRNVVEIACYGRMSLVEDRRLGVRDLTRSGKAYKDEVITFRNMEPSEQYSVRWRRRLEAGGTRPLIVVPKAEAGWLQPSPKGWQITPCEFARVGREALAELLILSDPSELTDLTTESAVDAVKKKMDFWSASSSADAFGQVQEIFERFKSCLVRGEPEKVLSDVPGKIPRKAAATLFSNEFFRLLPRNLDLRERTLRDAYLVVTGPASAKDREFVFYGRKPVRLTLHAEVWRKFLAAHEHEGEGRGAQGAEDKKKHNTPWSYWRDRLKRNLCGPGAPEDAEPGVPVFWLADEAGNVKALGLAMMFRLPAEVSIAEAIGNVSQAHAAPSRPDAYDMAELLFGAVRDTPETSLRGRVSVGAAWGPAVPSEEVGAPAGADRRDEAPNLLLSSPKPSFYPSYLRQPARDGESLITYMHKSAEVRGWKRYPPRKEVARSDVPEEQLSQATRLRPLKAGTRFTGTLRLHNLRTVELGALLWALRLGQAELDAEAHAEDAPAHSLGLGRPYGYGQVWLRITGGRLRPNHPDAREVRWQGKLANAGEASRTLDGALSAFRTEADTALRTATIPGSLPAPGAAADWEGSEIVQALLHLARPTMGSRSETYMTLRVGSRGENTFADAKNNKMSLPAISLGQIWQDRQRFAKPDTRAASPGDPLESGHDVE